ncbi:hypothetical protein CcaCcLH18_06769 [Colletotrichum camelliae]|nr:hypothetical protein CcaCcLH18_06769 [Colletotrichum camelliae]
MWRNFIYPGLHVDYKGKLLIITKEEDEMPDEPWFYTESETFSNKKEYLADNMQSIDEIHKLESLIPLKLNTVFTQRRGDGEGYLLFDFG